MSDSPDEVSLQSNVYVTKGWDTITGRGVNSLDFKGTVQERIVYLVLFNVVCIMKTI